MNPHLRRIKLVVSFDGSGFAGWQSQAKGERTVQDVLEAALAQIPGAVPKVSAAGRTDAGVHALAMPVHYDTQDPIPIERVTAALNQKLPSDVRVQSAQVAEPGFHARFSCCWRQYRYRLWPGGPPSALERQRVWWLPKALDLAAMQEAIALLRGTHNFSAFATQEERSAVRSLWVAELMQEGREVQLEWVGSGFVRGQVRGMVGTLVQVGQGKRPPQDLAVLLQSGQRNQAGPSAPAHGLYFVSAGYESWVNP